MNKKSQVLMEFVAMFGVTIILFIGVAVIIYQEKANIVSESELSEVQKFAIGVQTDILIASTMLDGFSQNIALSDKINDKPYAIQIISSNLYVTQEEQEIILPLPPINGTISNKQFKIIKNLSGMYIQ